VRIEEHASIAEFDVVPAEDFLSQRRELRFGCRPAQLRNKLLARQRRTQLGDGRFVEHLLTPFPATSGECGEDECCES